MRLPLLFAPAIFFATPIAHAQNNPAATVAATRPPPLGATEARVTWLRGRVELSHVGPASAGVPSRDAVEGEVLPAGTRVLVTGGAAAELLLPNGTTLALAENAQLVLFSSPTPLPAGVPAATMTTLTHGALRVSSTSGESAAMIPVTTMAATVYVGRGDGMIAADLGGHIARIATQRGRMRVWTPQREYILRAGSGIVEEPGRPRQPYRQLPPQPVWTTPPPERLISTGEPVDLNASYALRGTRVASQWRVELARDERFHDLVAVDTAAADTLRWQAHALTPGRYFVRVTALDPERFESLASPVARVVVASPTIVPGALPAASQRGRLARVEVPDGFFCGLDGARMVATSAELRLVPGRAHHLRCASRPDGDDVREMTVGAALAGPLQRDVRMHGTALGESVLALRLRDAEGEAVPYAEVTVSADRGVTVETVREARERGVYNAAVHWPRGVQRARFRFGVNGAETFEQELSQEQAPPSPIPP